MTAFFQKTTFAVKILLAIICWMILFYYLILPVIQTGSIDYCSFRMNYCDTVIFSSNDFWMELWGRIALYLWLITMLWLLVIWKTKYQPYWIVTIAWYALLMLGGIWLYMISLIAIEIYRLIFI